MLGRVERSGGDGFTCVFFLLFIYLLIFLNRFSGLFCGVVRFGLEV